ncbi:winged helix-turn-helix transcriptional regulator [Streptosporangiaceae bacterium NEAU-GS5]|nr:winged helix-turn-helix transcriptional regulator [Streptosporangiaceae bacterium NEAU-GS5]
MIDPSADRPVYKQLADLVRGQIERGELHPEQRLPAETDYVREFGISRDSVRRAMGLLRAEGLVTTTQRGSRVRPESDVDEVEVPPHVAIGSRMPTDQERREFRIEPGVPVFVLRYPDGREAVLPADRVLIVTTP